MPTTPVFTIGHGTRSAADLLSLLQQYGIRYLVDVRSKPFSAYNPQYNQPVLKAFIEKHGVVYVFMGDSLGGRPDDPECYTDKGKVDYAVVQEKAFFRAGLLRVKTAFEKNIPIALMCSESKPGDCHRSRLIGAALTKMELPVQHITEEGALKDQQAVMAELGE